MKDNFIRMLEVIFSAVPAVLTVYDRVKAFIDKKKNNR